MTESSTTSRFERYNPHELEGRWRKHWRESGLYQTDWQSERPKYYAFTMFPYPSGNLHIGHWYSAALPDTRARFMRMRGHNVFFPMGFDAFGLPAENAAIKNGIDPKAWTYQNIATMKAQFELMGTMTDWDSEVITCSPEYYRWNQWFFLQFYKNGLAYKKEAFVNWDPVDQTVLANEQVVDGRGERSGALVERRLMAQWHFKITDYAEELLNFGAIDWPDKIRSMQTNWIGRSEGAEVEFATPAGPLMVFTTRPDTIFGATFMVLAPEHPLVAALTLPDQQDAVAAYKEQASRTSEMDRLAEKREKSGIFLGSYATSPTDGRQVPIYISDYVLITYGTGSIMGVPAQDSRDWDFAKKFDIPIIRTVQPPTDFGDYPYLADGPAINSGFLDGLEIKAAKAAMIEWLEVNEKGKRKITYRLRDWLISRQRYWGTPIPIIYCERCGEQPVPESDLPIKLPDVVEFLPTGQSPLKMSPEWYQCQCPNCGGPAVRDTDTMDTFVDSSWYFMRYLDPQNSDAAINTERVAQWLPADVYSGGIEHAILHLLYSRFWVKAARDLGLVNFDEPAMMLRNQGIILGEDGEKMSKSRGNVVNPDELVSEYGSDTVRLYLQFIGPWDQGGPWAPKGVNGIYNWLARVWSLFFEENISANEATSDAMSEKELRFALHSALKKVMEDTENFKFNTAVAAMMELSNSLGRAKRSALHHGPSWQQALHTLNLMIAPYAPHMAEEIWAKRGQSGSIHTQSWPDYDPSALVRDEFELVLQVSGKVRGKVMAAAGISEAEAVALAQAVPNIAAMLAGKTVVKQIYVPGKLLNMVVR
jgi:leucyl-tRNA synthetase